MLAFFDPSPHTAFAKKLGNITDDEETQVYVSVSHICSWYIRTATSLEYLLFPLPTKQEL